MMLDILSAVSVIALAVAVLAMFKVMRAEQEKVRALEHLMSSLGGVARND